MTTGDNDSIAAVVTHRFDAPPERVFDALLDPARIRHWFGPGLGQVTRCDVDARVGGTFWIVQQRGGEEVAHTGEYLELQRPHRLRFTWRVPPHEDVSTVTISLAPLAQGCEVTLVHEMGAEWADYKDRTARAWDTMLQEIARLIADARETSAADRVARDPR